MKLEQEAFSRRSSVALAPAPTAIQTGGDEKIVQLSADILKRLASEFPRAMAAAPGRLDIMGGVAEHSGGLVLHMPLSDQVVVGVQRRSDGVFSLASLHSADHCDGAPTILNSRDFQGFDGAPLDPERVRLVLKGALDGVRRCALSVLLEAVRSGTVPMPSGGLSMVIESELDSVSEAGADAAVAAATLTALARALDVTLNPLQAITLCHHVQNHYLRLPVGVADAACSLAGEARAISQVRCDPCTLLGPVPLPDGVEFFGVDCGVSHPEAVAKYERVRATAFMGRTLIERIIQHEGGKQASWNGTLAGLSAQDYVERFRDRIPTKLKGADFLSRFGETGDPLTRIDPDESYKVRSRTEHQIYEHARSGQFVECIARATRSGDARNLVQAGELMYASHWSYGQRCGLGGIETDLLVNLIRRHDERADLYGAKIGGRGCGGVVTVLLRSTERAVEALEAVCREYRSRTGRSARLLRGSSPGALISGARIM